MSNKQNSQYPKPLPQIQSKYFKIFNNIENNQINPYPYTLNNNPLFNQKFIQNKHHVPFKDQPILTFNQISRKLDYNLKTETQQQRQLSQFQDQKQQNQNLKKQIKRLSQLYQHENRKHEQQLGYYANQTRQNTQRLIQCEFRNKQLQFENRNIKQQLQKKQRQQNNTRNKKRNFQQQNYDKMMGLTKKNEELQRSLYQKQIQIGSLKNRLSKYQEMQIRLEQSNRQIKRLQQQLKNNKKIGNQHNKSQLQRKLRQQVLRIQQSHKLSLGFQRQSLQRSIKFLQKQLQSTKNNLIQLQKQFKQKIHLLQTIKQQHHCQIKKYQILISKKQNQIQQQKQKYIIQKKKLQTQHQIIQIQIQTIQKTIAIKDINIHDLTLLIENTKNKYHQESINYQKSISQFQIHIQNIIQQKKNYQEEINSLNNHIQQCQHKINNQSSQIQSLYQKQQQLAKMLEVMQNKYLKLENTHTELIKDLQYVQNQKKKLQEVYHHQKKQKGNILDDMRNLSHQNDLLKRDLEHLHRKYDDLNDTYLKSMNRSIKGVNTNPQSPRYEKNNGQSELKRRIVQKSLTSTGNLSTNNNKYNTLLSNRVSLGCINNGSTLINQFTLRQSPQNRNNNNILMQKNYNSRSNSSQLLQTKMIKIDEKQKLNEVILKRCKLILNNQKGR